MEAVICASQLANIYERLTGARVPWTAVWLIGLDKFTTYIIELLLSSESIQKITYDQTNFHGILTTIIDRLGVSSYADTPGMSATKDTDEQSSGGYPQYQAASLLFESINYPVYARHARKCDRSLVFDVRRIAATLEQSMRSMRPTARYAALLDRPADTPVCTLTKVALAVTEDMQLRIAGTHAWDRSVSSMLASLCEGNNPVGYLTTTCSEYIDIFTAVARDIDSAPEQMESKRGYDTDDDSPTIASQPNARRALSTTNRPDESSEFESMVRYGNEFVDFLYAKRGGFSYTNSDIRVDALGNGANRKQGNFNVVLDWRRKTMSPDMSITLVPQTSSLLDAMVSACVSHADAVFSSLSMAEWVSMRSQISES